MVKPKGNKGRVNEKAKLETTGLRETTSHAQSHYQNEVPEQFMSTFAAIQQTHN